jgi:hypothetical protein
VGRLIDRPPTALSADLVAAVAFEVRDLLERYELAPLRAAPS